ncbi:MAG: hypothetical protein ACFB8W_23865 [Elainellaceae cyanobacterium]
MARWMQAIALTLMLQAVAQLSATISTSSAAPQAIQSPPASVTDPVHQMYARVQQLTDRLSRSPRQPLQRSKARPQENNLA